MKIDKRGRVRFTHNGFRIELTRRGGVSCYRRHKSWLEAPGTRVPELATYLGTAGTFLSDPEFLNRLTEAWGLVNAQ